MTDTPVAADTAHVTPVVCEMVRLIAPRKIDEVTPDHGLIGDLGFHSLVLAELGYNLEDLYDLRPLAPEEAMKLQHVSDIIEFVTTEMAAGRARPPAEEDAVALFGRYGADVPAA